ncbi:DUF305 domain-containing protein [Paraburkholderia sp.]|uniref:DUF305 domain-containing protein n=1 Tax=Paraburkholderia sp. TaxID=1926495 RepID=UPI003D6E9B18
MRYFPAQLRSAWRTRCTVLAVALSAMFATPVFAAGATPTASTTASPEAPFLAENDAAMTKMMNDMTVSPSGDVDRDFVAMMVPHHQGAIDMAQAELRYGHNEQLRRIAQEIVVEQQQEIVAMHVALGQPLPPSAPAPDQQQAAPSSSSSHAMHGMSMSAPTTPTKESP